VAPLLAAAPSPAQGAAAPPAPAPGAPPAAQVRWDGPANVPEGGTFDVALKLTSAQAVRSLPLQLSFDAKVLESVGVRAGSFFSADGNFDYRVSPNGSILVGPSGMLDATSDAELVVLTFKPIRAGATTELTLSSFSLRGADGRAIALNHPPAFRVSIE
jgi:hypothetical protein